MFDLRKSEHGKGNFTLYIDEPQIIKGSLQDIKRKLIDEYYKAIEEITTS